MIHHALSREKAVEKPDLYFNSSISRHAVHINNYNLPVSRSYFSRKKEMVLGGKYL